MTVITRTARRFRTTLALVLALTALTALPATARAEDGYNLWLRYARIENVALRNTYRQAISGVVVQGTPATAAIVSRELARGLEGLLGVDSDFVRTPKHGVQSRTDGWITKKYRAGWDLPK